MMNKTLSLMVSLMLVIVPCFASVDSECDWITRAIIKIDRISYKNAREFAGTILESSRQYNLDPCLLVAMIHVESNFRRTVVAANDYGPMQVNKFWFKKLNIKESDVYGMNGVRIGAKILSIKRKEVSGDPTWWSVYNSRNAEKRRIYERKINRILNKIKPSWFSEIIVADKNQNKRDKM